VCSAFSGRIAFQGATRSLSPRGDLSPVIGIRPRATASRYLRRHQWRKSWWARVTAHLLRRQTANGISLNARGSTPPVSMLGPCAIWGLADAPRVYVRARDADGQGRSASALKGALVRKWNRHAGNPRSRRRLAPPRGSRADPRQRNGQATTTHQSCDLSSEPGGCPACSLQSRIVASSVQLRRCRIRRWARTPRSTPRARAPSYREDAVFPRPIDLLRRLPPSTAMVRHTAGKFRMLAVGLSARPTARSHHRRSRAAPVVMACGEGDRSRNPPADSDRARDLRRHYLPDRFRPPPVTAPRRRTRTVPSFDDSNFQPRSAAAAAGAHDRHSATAGGSPNDACRESAGSRSRHCRPGPRRARGASGAGCGAAKASAHLEAPLC